MVFQARLLEVVWVPRGLVRRGLPASRARRDARRSVVPPAQVPRDGKAAVVKEEGWHDARAVLSASRQSPECRGVVHKVDPGCIAVVAAP